MTRAVSGRVFSNGLKLVGTGMDRAVGSFHFVTTGFNPLESEWTRNQSAVGTAHKELKPVGVHG